MDSDEIAERLGSALVEDASHLNRICEQAAAELIGFGTEPDSEVASAAFSADAFLICADRSGGTASLLRPARGRESRGAGPAAGGQRSRKAL
jgi:hypothetical protein